MTDHHPAPDVATPVAGRRRAPGPRPPGWALASAALTPVAMIGGWTVAAAVQPPSFDSVRDTISALATSAATAGWVMTAGLAATGVCHVATAAGLRPARAAGRLLLATGGVAAAAVAALPVDVAPRAHGVAAGVAFVALSVWPAASWRRGTRGVLGPRVALGATAGLLTLLAAFAVELQGGGPGDGALTGLAERALAGAQSVWPLVVVLALGRTATPAPTDAPLTAARPVAP